MWQEGRRVGRRVAAEPGDRLMRDCGSGKMMSHTQEVHWRGISVSLGCLLCVGYSGECRQEGHWEAQDIDYHQGFGASSGPGT